MASVEGAREAADYLRLWGRASVYLDGTKLDSTALDPTYEHSTSQD